MSGRLHYVVCLRTTNQDWHLLWKDGGSKPDRYVALPRSSKFLLAKTRSGLAKLATERGIAVSNQLAHVVDIAGMHRALTRLRPDRPLSEHTAQVLLESWNALEDMGRSIEAAPIPADPAIKDEAQRVYDKLFYGNNLPSVTPAGSSYQVTLTSRELDALRKAMRGAWREICERSAQFSLS